MRKLILLTLSLLVVLGLAACGGGSQETAPAPAETEQNAPAEETQNETNGEVAKLKVGVTAGPHEQILEKVAEVALSQGLEIEPVVFNEYVMPNIALAEGELDANIFQHLPYLEQFKADRNLDLIEVAPAVNFPMGIYSTEIKDVSEITEGAKLGLPNDPTNGARALMLFEAAGLIKLDPEVGASATVLDIVENPLNLEFVEVEASQIPRMLDEFDAAAINTNYAIEHGYVPTRDSFFIEPSDSPWINWIVVRTEDKDNELVQRLIDAYHTDEVKQFIEDTFEGSVIAAW